MLSICKYLHWIVAVAWKGHSDINKDTVPYFSSIVAISLFLFHFFFFHVFLINNCFISQKIQIESLN